MQQLQRFLNEAKIYMTKLHDSYEKLPRVICVNYFKIVHKEKDDKRQRDTASCLFHWVI